MVELLEGFTNVSQPSTNAKSALQLDLSAILKNQQALFAFMQYLKEEGAINQLQFCLSIGELFKCRDSGVLTRIGQGNDCMIPLSANFHQKVLVP